MEIKLCETVLIDIHKVNWSKYHPNVWSKALFSETKFFLVTTENGKQSMFVYIRLFMIIVKGNIISNFLKV